MKKVAFFTMAVGKDPIYFDSVRRYFPYNRKYFGQDQTVDYFLFTDREEHIDGIENISCESSVWPYTTLLKNNSISNYLTQTGKWDDYSYIFFIDADFAIGDEYDFFSHDFILAKPYWNDKNGGGFFYGGKTKYFKALCDLFYEEIQFIYENKLSLPYDLDEFYLGLFREQYQDIIHLIAMDQQTNTLIFYDNENLDEKIKQQGKRLFMQPYKADGRANKTMITDTNGKETECIVNTEQLYIFNNYTYDFGRLLKKEYENLSLSYFPSFSSGHCMATNCNAWIVGPEGELYNCQAEVGVPSKVIGNIKESTITNMDYVSEFMVGVSPFENKQCRQCAALPLCGGGCALDRINKKNGKKIDTCAVFKNKNKLRELLKIHYDIKKQRQEITTL